MSQKVNERPRYRSVRRTFEISDDERAYLEWLAERRGSNLSFEVRRAIRILHMIESRVSKGAKLLIQENGHMIELEVL